MTLKEAQEIAKEYREAEKWDFTLAPKGPIVIIVLDNRITELEKQLAKCQENKDRAHMSAAKYLAEIAAYKARLQELEAREKKQ